MCRINKLPVRNPFYELYKLSSANHENLNPGTNAINACLSRRYWPDTDERMDAESVVAAVRAYFRREIDASCERTRGERGAWCVILPAMWLLLFLLLHWMGSAAFSTWLTTLGFGVIVTMVCCRDPYAARRIGAADILARLEDPALIGVVAGYLSCPDLRIQQAARTALHKMLPCARAEHSRFIHADEMAQLIRVVISINPPWYASLGWDVREQIAVLRSFRYIGTAAAYAPVKTLLLNEASLFHPLVVAAKECLPVLEQLANEVRQAQTLLRPTSGQTEDTVTLLRAAQGTDGSASNQEAVLLLRAS